MIIPKYFYIDTDRNKSTKKAVKFLENRGFVDNRTNKEDRNANFVYAFNIVSLIYEISSSYKDFPNPSNHDRLDITPIFLKSPSFYPKRFILSNLKYLRPKVV